MVLNVYVSSHDSMNALSRYGNQALDDETYVILRLILIRRSQSMHAEAYGSVLFSATETASKPNLVMGFCQKIHRFELID